MNLELNSGGDKQHNQAEWRGLSSWSTWVLTKWQENQGKLFLSILSQAFTMHMHLSFTPLKCYWCVSCKIHEHQWWGY